VVEKAACFANNGAKFKGHGPHMGLNSVASGRLESTEQLVFMQDFVDLWLVHIRRLGGAPPLVDLTSDIPLRSATL
jgi:hypothetical protein